MLRPKSKLPRLGREFYQGRAMILWTHTFEHRATGWLSDTFHAHFREILIHACHRYTLATPCYVLMPDHWHPVWMGLDDETDQMLATAFLRKHLQPILGPVRLQDRAHDHVLREHERERGAFEAACSYVCQNPERGGLRAEWREWPFLGAFVPGYPDLDPRTDEFWPLFWRIYNRVAESQPVPALTRRATHDSRNPLREQREDLSA
jgi:REP element-mobilizing transposase RayT